MVLLGATRVQAMPLCIGQSWERIPELKVYLEQWLQVTDLLNSTLLFRMIILGAVATFCVCVTPFRFNKSSVYASCGKYMSGVFKRAKAQIQMFRYLTPTDINGS